jgi:hypothetical protein
MHVLTKSLTLYLELKAHGEATMANKSLEARPAVSSAPSGFCASVMFGVSIISGPRAAQLLR